MEKTLTDAARYKAGKSQMSFFLSNQYPAWRIVAVKSIQKILLNIDEFCSDLEFKGADTLSISETINGWLFEAMAQAEQAIEDLFSLLKNSTDIPYFAKKVVNYKANEVKRYIWDFKYDDAQYVLTQFQLPYFDLHDAVSWEEHQEVFKYYKESVLLIQDYLCKLIQFHKKYYLDYCQYKHGMAVALRPYGVPQQEVHSNPLEGVLMTFDNYHIEKRMHNGNMPQMALYLTSDVQPYVTELHEEENLLHYSMHYIRMEDVNEIVEMAYTLEAVVRENLIRRSEVTDEDTIHEWVFPLKDYGQQICIGFPIEK